VSWRRPQLPVPAAPGQRGETPESSGRWLDDATLVAAARADRQAFLVLYDRYLNPVHRYCFIRLGNRETAEDATSEVFVRALSALDGFRDGVFAGWLFRIAHNVVVDAQRRQRQAGFPLALDAAHEIEDPGSPPEETTIRNNDVAELRSALRRLSSDQRAVLELQLTGLATSEIAAALGRSEGAIRILRFRAQTRLRDFLGASVSDQQPERKEGRPC
jgi:RNA polymerase sigma-70 factor (ECF subfamily)